MNALLALAWSLLCQIYFSKKQPDYEWRRQTISELGKSGSACQWQVACYYFFPIALLIFSLLYGWYQMPAVSQSSLLFLLCIPLAYLVASFFPCDDGGPLWGSWRNNIHMLFGGLEYLGAMIGLWLVSVDLAALSVDMQNLSVGLVRSASLLIAVCFLLMLMPITQPVIGVIQRVAEVTWLVALVVISNNLMSL